MGGIWKRPDRELEHLVLTGLTSAHVPPGLGRAKKWVKASFDDD